MRLFNKVAIIGVGLIGGSIALAIKKKKLAQEIIGVSRHKETLSLAKKIRAIDRGAQDLSIIKDADLVILATPTDTIINLAGKISQIVEKECIVSDVGSTKEEVVAKLERIFPKYIGSHPLAGSQKRGLINAYAAIFRNSLCVLTPTKNTDKKTQGKIRRLWIELGAEVIYLTPSLHDKVLSLISHLPHLAAFSLIGVVPTRYLKFASTGLKDTTRIAASDSQIWTDILCSNRENIIKAIDLFQANLSQIKSAIQKRDKQHLISILKKAKKKREKL